MRFARTVVGASRSRGAADSWSAADTMALLQAVEPWGEPEAAWAISVLERRVEIREGARGSTSHVALVRCGRLVAVLDIAIRALGRVPHVHVAEHADGPVLVTIAALGRRAATARDLARRRAAHRLATSGDPPARGGRVDGRALARLVQGAETGQARLRLLNGPERDELPAWHPPGTVPQVTWGLDLPWTRDPVLAACTPEDGVRAAVLGGIVAHRACVDAVLHGQGATVHPLTAGVPSPRRGPGTDGEVVHAVVHVHGPREH